MDFYYSTPFICIVDILVQCTIFCFVLLQLQKENTEDYIEYLKSIDWLDEAAKRLVGIIDDDGHVSKEGKSKHQVMVILEKTILIFVILQFHQCRSAKI